jgi:hypothetical protein
MKSLDLKTTLTIILVGAGIAFTIMRILTPEQWFIGTSGMVLAYYFSRNEPNDKADPEKKDQSDNIN